MEFKAIGNQLCQYGNQSFFKGIIFKMPENKKSLHRDAECQKSIVMGLGDCIPVRPFHSDSLIECLAEIRMIWKDKVEQTFLLSVKFYFLPENTPRGRIGHGEDELVAVKDVESPKGRIIIRAEDFSTWLVDGLKWNWGLEANYYEKPLTKMMTPSNGIPVTSLLSNTKLDLSEVEKEKGGNIHSNVTVLSYSRYCRYRAALKRLEHVEDKKLQNELIETFSGFVAKGPNTRIMFARETFECPDLESHDSLCPHLAPKLKGKPLKGRRKQVTSRVSECSSPAPSTDSCESDNSDVFDGKHLIKNNDFLKTTQRLTRNKGKSDSVQTEVYTTLSTGRVSKQRLPLTPLKSTSGNKRKRKPEDSDVSSSDDDDDDYTERNVNRKIKLESVLKRQNSSKEENDQEIQLSNTLKMPYDTKKSPEELDFLIRLNSFMAERSSTYTKFAWELRDVNLFTIYTRVQKLGGFNAIADNRVWKNLFEDLSEPGKCITQGITKRRYERILLPFELHEREMRENGKNSRSELTISTIPKNSTRKDMQPALSKRRPSTSPAIEIIPLKNGSISMDQSEYNSSNDGASMPGQNDFTEKRRTNEIDRMPTSSFGGQKENIPLMLRSTTIVPLMRDGIPASIVDLVDSGDDESKNLHGKSNMKKRKLDILREGGLEVTPISRKPHNAMQITPSSKPSTMQPSVSLMSLAHVRAPPVIQSLSMYQSTRQVFKNPKEEVFPNKNYNSQCLDLTSKKHHSDPRQPQRSNSLMSIEEVQRNYRGSNPDLQITLVKPHMEIPSSSNSKNTHFNHKNRQQSKPKPKPTVSSSSSVPLPPLNPVIVAAANELQKMQQNNMPSFFPFLSGLDITPQQSNKQLPPFDQSQATLMSYLSALYANPLLQGQNILPNMSPAAEFLKLYNHATSASSSRIPSSKN